MGWVDEVHAVQQGGGAHVHADCFNVVVLQKDALRVVPATAFAAVQGPCHLVVAAWAGMWVLPLVVCLTLTRMVWAGQDPATCLMDPMHHNLPAVGLVLGTCARGRVWQLLCMAAVAVRIVEGSCWLGILCMMITGHARQQVRR